MSYDVTDAPLSEIVDLMERRHIRRVPIVEAGPDGSERLIGIVPHLTRARQNR